MERPTNVYTCRKVIYTRGDAQSEKRMRIEKHRGEAIGGEMRRGKDGEIYIILIDVKRCKHIYRKKDRHGRERRVREKDAKGVNP